jgi:hypothetical protein
MNANLTREPAPCGHVVCNDGFDSCGHTGVPFANFDARVNAKIDAHIKRTDILLARMDVNDAIYDAVGKLDALESALDAAGQMDTVDALGAIHADLVTLAQLVSKLTDIARARVAS